ARRCCTTRSARSWWSPSARSRATPSTDDARPAAPSRRHLRRPTTRVTVHLRAGWALPARLLKEAPPMSLRTRTANAVAGTLLATALVAGGAVAPAAAAPTATVATAGSVAVDNEVARIRVLAKKSAKYAKSAALEAKKAKSSFAKAKKAKTQKT